MSAPVDVLAVMARAHTGEMTAANAELWEARVAVAELIAAANQAYEFVDEMGAVHGINNTMTKSRLRAALARVGGAA